VANYFEEQEWQQTKKAIDEKIKNNKPDGGNRKVHKDIFGEGATNVKIDWNLVRLFNTGQLNINPSK
jgi:hypothetical protein